MRKGGVDGLDERIRAAIFSFLVACSRQEQGCSTPGARGGETQAALF
jgi:hypothetical protein